MCAGEVSLIQMVIVGWVAAAWGESGVPVGAGEGSSGGAGVGGGAAAALAVSVAARGGVKIFSGWQAERAARRQRQRSSANRSVGDGYVKSEYVFLAGFVVFM